jgi:DNA ligase-1
MHKFADTAERISATTSKLKKLEVLANYFRGVEDDDLRAAAVFLTGRPFPLYDARTLNVGWSALGKAIQEVSGASDTSIHDVYLERGDLGEVAERLLPAIPASNLTPAQVLTRLEELVGLSNTAKKVKLVTELLRSLTPLEAKYVVKMITSDLRIGLKENTVEEAVAKAFEQPPDAVRRANMMLGDIGETAVLARHGRLEHVSLKLFRPIKFMLATPIEMEDEIFANFPDAFFVEDKYDGIRGQLHAGPQQTALFSRTLDDVSHQFPEIIAAASNLDRPLIVDGEVIPWQNGQVLPFASLQKRLGRKQPTPTLMAQIPVALMIFDILFIDGRTIIDEPLRERKKILESLRWPEGLQLALFRLVEQRMPLGPFFAEAEARRNEGLMLKDAASVYAPGKRGKAWLKWKKALATLDVVVTGVEFGHGRRRDVLSDYTFAVQGDGTLLNIGKAYSGLTDREILEMTEYFMQHTTRDFGRFRLVEPKIVIEVAFNGIQKSSRHGSGYALRFPRIVRLRPDKTVGDIDSLQTVAQIFNR